MSAYGRECERVVERVRASKQLRASGRHLRRFHSAADIAERDAEQAKIVLAAARNMGIEERAWPEFRDSASAGHARQMFSMLCMAHLDGMDMDEDEVESLVLEEVNAADKRFANA